MTTPPSPKPKSAEEWTKEIRASLGEGLRYDPLLTTGHSLIQTLVEQRDIQIAKAALRKARVICDSTIDENGCADAAECADRIIDYIDNLKDIDDL